MSKNKKVPDAGAPGRAAEKSEREKSAFVILTQNPKSGPWWDVETRSWWDSDGYLIPPREIWLHVLHSWIRDENGDDHKAIWNQLLHKWVEDQGQTKEECRLEEICSRIDLPSQLTGNVYESLFPYDDTEYRKAIRERDQERVRPMRYTLEGSIRFTWRMVWLAIMDLDYNWLLGEQCASFLEYPVMRRGIHEAVYDWALKGKPEFKDEILMLLSLYANDSLLDFPADGHRTSGKDAQRKTFRHPGAE